MPIVNEEKYYDLLKMEYSIISKRINEIDLGFTSIQSIPFLLFTGIIAVLISSDTTVINKNYIFLILPYLAFTLYYHITKYTITIYRIAGYKKSIENELNKIAGKNALIYESFNISESYHHKLTGGLYVIFLGTITFILTIGLEIQSSIMIFGKGSLMFIICNSLIAANIGYFIFLLLNLNNIITKTHELSKSIYEKNCTTQYRLTSHFHSECGSAKVPRQGVVHVQGVPRYTFRPKSGHDQARPGL